MTDNLLYCDFCDKSNAQVAVMFESKRSIICIECVLACAKILVEREQNSQIDAGVLGLPG